jgi:hypothetical protein|tara:strand:+ start:13330 stop:13587 length:258 start_codon:yes stop_codon:yes gene_type:complete
MSKSFTIAKTNSRNSSSNEFTGTIDELTNMFSYTLDCGRSWQHEQGNVKINTNPRGIKSLIKNLNNSINNSAANGWSNYSYVEVI